MKGKDRENIQPVKKKKKKRDSCWAKEKNQESISCINWLTEKIHSLIRACPPVNVIMSLSLSLNLSLSLSLSIAWPESMSPGKVLKEDDTFPKSYLPVLFPFKLHLVMSTEC